MVVQIVFSQVGCKLDYSCPLLTERVSHCTVVIPMDSCGPKVMALDASLPGGTHSPICSQSCVLS